MSPEELKKTLLKQIEKLEQVICLDGEKNETLRGIVDELQLLVEGLASGAQKPND